MKWEDHSAEILSIILDICTPQQVLACIFKFKNQGGWDASIPKSLHNEEWYKYDSINLQRFNKTTVIFSKLKASECWVWRGQTGVETFIPKTPQNKEGYKYNSINQF